MLSDKYDITRHLNYKFLSDHNPSQTYKAVKAINENTCLSKNITTVVFDLGSVEGNPIHLDRSINK